MHKHVQNKTLRDSNLLELLVCSYPSQPIQPYHPLLPSRKRLRQSLICQGPRWEIIVLGSTLSTSHTAYKASLVAQMVKNLQCGRPGFSPWVGKIPLRRAWQSTPVNLPGDPHGQRSLVGYSPWGRKGLDTTEWLEYNTNTPYTWWLWLIMSFVLYFNYRVDLLSFSGH